MTHEDKARLFEGQTERYPTFTGYRDGEPQYELWPRRQSDRRELRWIIVAVLLALALSLWAGIAAAQPGSMSKGLICDTVEQVIEAVEDVTATQASLNEVEGCGHFRSPVRVPVDITILAKFETEYAVFTIARFIIPGLGVQYGYVGVEVKDPRA